MGVLLKTLKHRNPSIVVVGRYLPIAIDSITEIAIQVHSQIQQKNRIKFCLSNPRRRRNLNRKETITEILQLILVVALKITRIITVAHQRLKEKSKILVTITEKEQEQVKLEVNQNERKNLLATEIVVAVFFVEDDIP